MKFRRQAMVCVLLIFAIGWLSGICVPAATAAEKVYLINVEGTIEQGLAAYVERVINRAEREKAAAVLIEVNTPGGRVDAAFAIRDRITAASLPVFAFVTERAFSAGALITLACNQVAMAPASSIGAAEPRPADEKTISALRSEFEAVAEAHERDPEIAAAMVDPDVEIPGLVAKGELLSISAQRALTLDYCDLIASSRWEVLSSFGFPDAEVVQFDPLPAEKLVRFLTEPTVSSLLLTLGFLGLLFEVATAGWGVGGTVGLLALGLFFGSRIITGLAGLEAVFLFLLGLALLLVEVFVVPGFGIAGTGGLVAVLASLIMSFTSMRAATYSILTAMALTVILSVWLGRYFKKSRAFSKLVLSTVQKKEEGYVAPQSLERYLGLEGEAITTMRPAGTILVDGDRLDAVTEGGYIAAGTRIKVIRVEGNRIVVREL